MRMNPTRSHSRRLYNAYKAENSQEFEALEASERERWEKIAQVAADIYQETLFGILLTIKEGIDGKQTGTDDIDT